MPFITVSRWPERGTESSQPSFVKGRRSFETCEEGTAVPVDTKRSSSIAGSWLFFVL